VRTAVPCDERRHRHDDDHGGRDRAGRRERGYRRGRERHVRRGRRPRGQRPGPGHRRGGPDQMTRPARWTAFALAAAVTLVPTAAGAQVRTTRSSLADARLAYVKTRAHAEVERRLAVLDRLTTQVNAGSRFDGDHKTTLLGQL